MGETVSYPVNGVDGSGYFAPASGGSGPGVIVIQEWWGLVPHIRHVVDRLAEAGFTALAPDLYRGASASLTEPDEAAKLMMALNLAHAGKDMGGAVDYLLTRDEVTTETVGVIGFCMGGGLALTVACQRPDAVSACAPYYGIFPWPDSEPDWSTLAATVHGHFASEDAMFNPPAVADLQARLDALGKDAVLTVHPGVDHAFFNDDRPEVYDADTAAECWAETTEFFRSTIR